MTFLNNILDNDILFYGMFAGVACHIGLSFLSSVLHSGKGYTNTSVQTDTWEDYSDRPSQIIPDNVTSIDTMTPRFSPIDSIGAGSQIGPDPLEAWTQALAGDVSTVTTILPIPPVNIQIVPNTDIRAYSANNSLYNSKINEINELYSQEMSDNMVSDADLTYVVKSFTIAELNSNNVNEIILSIISCFNG